MTEEYPERYDEREYWQAVCTHPDHGDDVEAFIPRLTEAVAELDAELHSHSDEHIEILTYECIGAIVPHPNDKPDVLELLGEDSS